MSLCVVTRHQCCCDRRGECPYYQGALKMAEEQGYARGVHEAVEECHRLEAELLASPAQTRMEAAMKAGAVNLAACYIAALPPPPQTKQEDGE